MPKQRTSNLVNAQARAKVWPNLAPHHLQCRATLAEQIQPQPHPHPQRRNESKAIHNSLHASGAKFPTTFWNPRRVVELITTRVHHPHPQPALLLQSQLILILVPICRQFLNISARRARRAISNSSSLRKHRVPIIRTTALRWQCSMSLGTWK